MRDECLTRGCSKKLPECTSMFGYSEWEVWKILQEENVQIFISCEEFHLVCKVNFLSFGIFIFICPFCLQPERQYGEVNCGGCEGRGGVV